MVLNKHKVLNQQLEQFWKLETIGILDDPEITGKKVAMKKFMQTVKWDGKQFSLQ